MLGSDPFYFLDLLDFLFSKGLQLPHSLEARQRRIIYIYNINKYRYNFPKRNMCVCVNTDLSVSQNPMVDIQIVRLNRTTEITGSAFGGGVPI